jgi:hypothetical protein
VEASKGWLFALAVLLLLLLWHWQLVVSGGMGLAAMLVVYLVGQGQWKLPTVEWQRLWSRSNRPLTLAVVTGLIACFGTYLTIAIWQETGGSWLAKGIILEGFGILAILSLMGWQMFIRQTADRHSTSPSTEANQLLAELTNADPVHRLIAIRRITQQVAANPAELSVAPGKAEANLSPTFPLATAHVAECFRLMLNRETEPIVCRALVESLQVLNQAQSRSHSTPKATRQLQGSGSLPFAPKTNETKISEKTQSL